jgi:3-phosphoshikimate 1-carboxyvinyltransferase
VFRVERNQKYSPINETITGDFSSATFSAVGMALTGGKIDIRNLDFSDSQGDKGVFEIIEKKSAKIDLNAMPDALPALSVLATKAENPTTIFNVAQARIKETDRIKVMTEELSKMGAKIEEKPDGMIIYPSKLHGAQVSGHDDHRIVMALALAGMVADGETIIDTAEAAAVTYPTFVEDFRKLGANIEIC